MEKIQINEDVNAIYINLTKMTDENIDNCYRDMLEQSWVLKAIEKHCEAFQLECEKSVQIMILSIGDGAVGRCVKLLDIVHEWAHRSGQKKITIDDFMSKVLGFPKLY